MANLFDEDRAYRRWLDENPRGRVLNIRATLAPGYAILHTSQCPTVNNTRYRAGAFTERAYRKVCAPTAQELRDWLRREIPEQGDFSAVCACDRILAS